MQILNIFHVLIAIAMIAFILVQKGAGATAGAAFGSGASGTVFGARGAGNFLSRSTWVLAALFCLISLSMAVIVSRSSLKPETDLGVVATAPAESGSDKQAATEPNSEKSVTSKQAVTSDLPAIEKPAETAPAANGAGDLPAAGAEQAKPADKKEKNQPGDGS